MPMWVVSRGDGNLPSRIIRAPDARAAAEKFQVSVLDLRNGIDLHVQPFSPTHAFHREYSHKGADGEWHYTGGDGPRDPVTIEREVT